jgi:hypothetical protein
MENGCDTIISEYRRADLNKRLHMYLSYRDLRKDFMEIESDQVPGFLEKGAPGASKPATFRKNCSRSRRTCS